MTRATVAASTGVGGGAFTVVPARHPWRWAAGSILTAIMVLLVFSAVTNPRFGWDKVGRYFRDVTIVHGIGITLFLTVVCMVVGVALGVILAVMQLSPNPVARTFAGGYVTIFRGTPVLVQLLFWFNLAALYPTITFGIPGLHLDANQLITPMTAAILGLGLNEAAYMSEIVRAGIQSVDHGQSEAAGALGMPRILTLTRVVLPQAMRVIIPPTGNEFIGMLKTTSLVSVLAVPDLLYSAQIIYSKNLQVIPLLIIASIWYIIVTTIFTVGQGYLERRYSRGTSRNAPPTTLGRLKTFFSVHSPLATGKGKADER
jgi:polar amino acid transport system permease protein